MTGHVGEVTATEAWSWVCRICHGGKHAHGVEHTERAALAALTEHYDDTHREAK